MVPLCSFTMVFSLVVRIAFGALDNRHLDWRDHPNDCPLPRLTWVGLAVIRNDWPIKNAQHSTIQQHKIAHHRRSTSSRYLATPYDPWLRSVRVRFRKILEPNFPFACIIFDQRRKHSSDAGSIKMSSPTQHKSKVLDPCRTHISSIR